MKEFFEKTWLWATFVLIVGAVCFFLYGASTTLIYLFFSFGFMGVYWMGNMNGRLEAIIEIQNRTNSEQEQEQE